MTPLGQRQVLGHARRCFDASMDAAGTEKAMRRPRAAEARRSARNLDDNGTLDGKKLENRDIVNQGCTNQGRRELTALLARIRPKERV